MVKTDAEKICDFQRLIERLRSTEEMTKAQRQGTMPQGYHFRHEQDFKHIADPQHVGEYAQQCQKAMQLEEKIGFPGENMQARLYANQHCFARQREITPKMRRILIDWIVEVSGQYRLQEETIFLTVNYIDRHCSMSHVSRSHFQLVGIAALLIASKYEEIYPPESDRYVAITDNAYTRDQLFEKELEILRDLEFNLTVPTAYRFLQRFATLGECDLRLFCMANYFINLALIDLNMNKW